MKKLFLFLVFVVGCSTPKETLIEDRTIPVVGYKIVVEHDTVQVFVPSPCDTAKILEIYCHGLIEGDTLGTHYKFLYESTRQSNEKLLRRKSAVIIKRDTVVSYRDTTVIYRPIIQEYGFWKKVGLVLTTVGVLAILFGVAFVASRFGFIKL